jgi:hypothetical protein
MKRISLRHFTTHVQEYDEPVEVVLQIKGSGEIALLGTWQPEVGFSRPPVETEKPAPSDGEDLVEEIRQLKRELAQAHRAEDREYGTMPPSVPAKGSGTFKPTSNVRASTKPAPPAQVTVGTASFNSRPFTPVPKGK